MYLLMSTNFLKQRACEKQEKQKNPTVDDLKIFQIKFYGLVFQRSLA